ncbi:MAG: hypothetical protein P8M02_04675 [Flavobacteriaceae bacterium]|jgi:hypothetical protein|nr:hypothetical protein [Flavobacteriaceae bacterium]MDG2386692.1 hypothetical protein [Flavobacteriaceae bacterium]
MKLKLLTKTNIEKELVKVRLKGQSSENTDFLTETFNDLDIKIQNDFDFDQLETHKIYHLEQIRDVCIRFRLRFLDLKYFKNKLPESALEAVNSIEAKHNTVLTDFKIMAPSVLFRLERKDDPLLFVPIGNGYYYLIHKWGNDLHPMRSILMWPFKNIWNLLITLLGVSWIATEMTPMGLFTKTPDTTSYWMLFFFMFKAIASVVLFYGFALGKNFNPAIWNSKYNKS